MTITRKGIKLVTKSISNDAHIEDQIDKLSNAKLCTTLDLKNESKIKKCHKCLTKPQKILF